MQTQAQKQDFIGGILAGVLVQQGGKIVGKAVEKGLEKIAARPDTRTTSEDVAKATPVITKEVEKAAVQEAQAQAEHKLDAEDHWRSRNIWGSFVGIITALNTIYIFWTNTRVETWEEWSIPIGILVTALTPLYSRFIAKKPLFK